MLLYSICEPPGDQVVDLAIRPKVFKSLKGCTETPKSGRGAKSKLAPYQKCLCPGDQEPFGQFLQNAVYSLSIAQAYRELELK